VERVGIAVRDPELPEQARAFLGICLRLIEDLVERVAHVEAIILGAEDGGVERRKNQFVDGLPIGAVLGAVSENEALMAAAAGMLAEPEEES